MEERRQMVDQKATETSLREAAVKAIREIAVKTGHSEEDMLRYSVRFLQAVMSWRQNSPSADDLDLKSVEEDLVGALRLALTIENAGGADRMILEGSHGYRLAIYPESKALKSGGKSKYPRIHL